MLFEKPVIIARMDDLDLELIGSVHMLLRPAREVLREIGRFSPDYVCVELYRALQPTKSFEIELARERYLDKFVPIDRNIDVTTSRYLCDTAPAVFLKETLVKYIFLPLNILSGTLYSQLPEQYEKLTGGRFFTFGWSREDTRVYIWERDEYMAGTLARLLKSGELGGRCAVLVGRRHVAGMKAVLEAYRSTGDVGSYYAGGRVYDVFSLAELDEPYTLSYEQSRRNIVRNRMIEGIVRSIFLPAYLLALFFIIAGIIVAASAIALTLLKRGI
jgi:hypothetical protein